MTLLFSNLFKQALTTFDAANRSNFKLNLITLKKLLNQLTIKDISLDENLVSHKEFSKPEKAPCTYVHIFQNDVISMGVFIIQNGYEMPLHDHPMMHGLIKVLFGTMLIKSYTKLECSNENDLITPPTQINVKPEPHILVNTKSDSASLTPFKRNYHEITAIDGVAAFFDILSPPYDANIPIYGKRKCHYYAKLLNEIKMNPTFCEAPQAVVLENIPAPQSFYCDTGAYDKPEFLLKYADTYCESDSSSSSN